MNKVFYGVVGLAFVYGVYQSIILYFSWIGNELGKFYLPPYQNWNYYYITIFAKFFAPHLIALFFAILFIIVAIKYNKKFGGQFFEKEEPYMGAFSIFLVSHPGWILYIFVFFGSYLLFQVIGQLTPTTRGERLPLYHFWVPSAVFVIIITEYLLANNAIWLRLSI